MIEGQSSRRAKKQEGKERCLDRDERVKVLVERTTATDMHAHAYVAPHPSLAISRDRLRANLLAKQYVLEVDLDHLIAFNEELANRIRETPSEIVPLVSSVVTALGAYYKPSHGGFVQRDGKGRLSNGSDAHPFFSLPPHILSLKPRCGGLQNRSSLLWQVGRTTLQTTMYRTMVKVTTTTTGISKQ